MGRLDNYEEVKDRLPRFWGCVKEGRITTEVLDHSENWDRVVIKAFLFDGETLIATGIAMDWKGKDNQANRTNWVEVAETSAIGRAIANSRYQDPNAKRPSKEEMQVALDRQDALLCMEKNSGIPLDTPPHKLKALCEKHGLTDKLLTDFCKAPGRVWIKGDKQDWTDAPKEKLELVYERARKNPEGFISQVKGT